MDLVQRIKSWRTRRTAFQVPRYRSRKVGVILFWVLFLWTFAISVTTFLHGQEAKRSAEPAIEAKTADSVENLATRPEAIEFSKAFIKEYFTWQRTDEGKKNREDRLRPFLLGESNPQAGLDMESLQWDAIFRSSMLKQVEETGKNSANIILQISYDLTRKKVDNSGDETKTVKQYVSIPVQTDGKAFVVAGNPHVVQIDEKANLKADKEERDEVKGAGIRKEIQEFLPTFFKSYTTASPSELEYVLEDKDAKGLQGSMGLDRIVSSKIYPGEKKGSYDVQVSVILIDTQSEAKMMMDYQLTIVKDGKQFVVTDLQNK